MTAATTTQSPPQSADTEALGDEVRERETPTTLMVKHPAKRPASTILTQFTIRLAQSTYEMCEPRFNTREYKACGHAFSWVNQEKSVFCDNVKVTIDGRSPCSGTVFSVYLKTEVLEGKCDSCKARRK
ncbi:hypothetical protein VTJ49DRAFT_6576 [Mycothermus thermophilus]|uniref:Uncharacterized protein n=1 Tax=Humicola insolens TaxID=85995 RepID=A0ABR3VIU9_HUMIN